MLTDNQIISLSGGKDSTAMLLMMLERNEPIHSIVFFDTSWEFPQLYEHIDLLERRTGLRIVRLKPDKSFDYWMFERQMPNNRIGCGWPSPSRRWCTREKINAIEKYVRTVNNPALCIGYAIDEQNRRNRFTIRRKRWPVRFPLIEWNITEKQALEYCHAKGYTWDGLYKHFLRVSCFCCPLQRLSELRKLRKYYPFLWHRMLDMGSQLSGLGARFKGDKSIADLERRFKYEEEQVFPEIRSGSL